MTPFSVEEAPSWITLSGYQLHALHDDLEISAHWAPEHASTKQLKVFQNYADRQRGVSNSSLFSLEHPEKWIGPIAFQAYMDTHAEPHALSQEFTPVSSHALSWMSVIAIYDLDSDDVGPPGRRNSQSDRSLPIVQPKLEDQVPISLHNQVPTGPVASTMAIQQGKSKVKQTLGSRQIKITRQLKVDEIVHMTHVPSTLIGTFMVVNKFIRAENPESWDSTSGGHINGDVKVCGFTPNPEQEVLCGLIILSCNRVNKCKFLHPTLFAGHERFEADEDAMQELWHQELDQNEAEVASDVAIICSNPSKHRKQYFIGCSKWTRSERGRHLYWPISPNVPSQTR
ncbi:hypothetical protein B0H10DRAFT_1961526 [Mycena sp. CBHHK59/15]|nr:hypothetical protein B0H10DRAFT_1961526 [Mycena sp. CBHHK59/15]